MSFDLHTIAVRSESQALQRSDRLMFGFAANVAMVAGSGAGAPVTTAVTGHNLPANYVVGVTPNQDAVAYVSGKTSTGFNVTVTPRLAANTLAAGTFDYNILS